MMKFGLLFLFSTTVFFGIAQSVEIRGQVLDVDGDPIRDVRYFLTSRPTVFYKTTVDGDYSVKYTAATSDTIVFEHVGFQRNTLLIDERLVKKAKNGTLLVDIVLPNRIWTQIDVFADRPDTLFGTQEYSVADFEFDRSGDIVLLTYEKTLDKGSVLRVLDENKTITDRYYIAENAIELRTDFRGNTHLITEDVVYFIAIEDHKINVFPENRDYFFRYVAPIIDTIGDRIFFSNYSEVYPAFDYLEFNRADSTYNTLLKVEDQWMMDLYRAEFKYVDVRTKLWAHNKELETGIDKEIWVGANVFTNSIYYEPLYAPLFKVGTDSILVFDHYKNFLFLYTEETGFFTDSTRIFYHKDAKKSGWEQPLIQDSENDIIYGIFERNGYTYLSKINLETGLIEHNFRLNYKYVESIHVKGGYVYYIYRPYESVQKKYIYRERLKSK